LVLPGSSFVSSADIQICPIIPNSTSFGFWKTWLQWLWYFWIVDKYDEIWLNRIFFDKMYLLGFILFGIKGNYHISLCVWNTNSSFFFFTMSCRVIGMVNCHCVHSLGLFKKWLLFTVEWSFSGYLVGCIYLVSSFVYIYLCFKIGVCLFFFDFVDWWLIFNIVVVLLELFFFWFCAWGDVFGRVVFVVLLFMLFFYQLVSHHTQIWNEVFWTPFFFLQWVDDSAVGLLGILVLGDRCA
jgi:hypothetical protein